MNPREIRSAEEGIGIGFVPRWTITMKALLGDTPAKAKGAKGQGSGKTGEDKAESCLKFKILKWRMSKNPEARTTFKRNSRKMENNCLANIAYAILKV